MLKELRIENFAIISSLELHFNSGLVIFTGETGAGKSIILDAIEALVGGRVDAGMVRAGSERAVLEAVFSFPEANREAVQAVLEREGLFEHGGEVTLGREIRAEGRTVARVNGRSVAVGLLKEIGTYLIDIHGQSEHLSLLNVRQHLHLLDRFSSNAGLLESYREKYRRLQAARKELSGLRQLEAESLRKTDLLQFQLGEIEAARLQTGEEEELQQERTRLANAENLTTLSQEALVWLEDGGPEGQSISDLLGKVVRAMEGLARYDQTLAPLTDQAASAAENLTDVGRELRHYQEGIEFNPRRLDQIEERLELIHRLQRKYGGSMEAVLKYAAAAREDLDKITHAGERISELETLESEYRQELGAAGWALSQERLRCAEMLDRQVEAELKDLSMSGARFSTDLRIEPDADGVVLPDERCVVYDENGIDRVEFLIAPNPGEGLKPLVKIASGGETSRLMLALKDVLARADDVPTLIFDEIDQGIGGRVGLAVGEKLWSLGRHHQVMCVTHLPQLAAFSDQHFGVRKEIDDGRTITHVKELDSESQALELAQMLGGVTDANLIAARDTLDVAQTRIAAAKNSM